VNRPHGPERIHRGNVTVKDVSERCSEPTN
jgi:hypothetical protein